MAAPPVAPTRLPLLLLLPLLAPLLLLLALQPPLAAATQFPIDASARQRSAQFSALEAEASHAFSAASHTSAEDSSSRLQRPPHAGPVLVTGATGRTGNLVYKALRELGMPVRALVRNATKARELLGCTACDATDGIFVGDITAPDTLAAPMRGARSLVILTSSYPVKGPDGNWTFPEGEQPVDIDWRGSNNQLRAALAARVGHVLLVSSMGTTEPDSFLDRMGSGHVLFYKLNGEADLMASGLTYTIVKPGGLLNTEGGKALLLAGHDDELTHARVSRADVAAVLVAAVLRPQYSANLRFDLSSDDARPATNDFRALFEDARAWGRPAQ